ncbi:hypothetical protein WKI65_44035 [Streptomyces sp. MS1.AVA.3]|uniref:hypothetical protein n=1 Tax=Streptomyces decoyicus TaxID=249567 RepID=UPI0030C07A4C
MNAPVDTCATAQQLESGAKLASAQDPSPHHRDAAQDYIRTFYAAAVAYTRQARDFLPK